MTNTTIHMVAFSIYLAGVGGQGIGLLSEIILRAGDHAGLPVKGVDTHGLEDARMQNIAMLAVIAGNNLVPGVGPDHYRQAMADLMAGPMLSRNRALFESHLAG